jgi:two-component system chemotaxis response regulator CheY
MSSRHILIAEDSAVTRAFLVSVLEEMENFNIIEVSSGFEALKQLPRQKFNLIITDINMPDINGLELINFIRSNSQYASIPLIVVTTEGAERDREKGLALGADEYLVKPIDPALLQELTRKYLSGSDTERNTERDES